ncbi:MAG: sulfatase [Candidatus Aminicenantaceae bacterium]
MDNSLQFKKIRIVLLLILFAFVLSCTRKDQAKMTNANFLYSLKTENTFFDRVNHAENYYFYKGWRERSKIAICPDSFIRFYNFSDRNRRLKLSIHNPHSESEKILKIKTFLNNHLLEELMIKEKNETFVLLFPKDFLKEGENFIHLKVDKDFLGERDLNLGKDNKTFFEVGYIFFLDSISSDVKKNIRENKIKGAGCLIQPANSSIKVAFDSRKISHLLYEFKANKIKTDGKLQFLIYDNRGKKISYEEIELNHNKKSKGTLEGGDYQGKIVVEIKYSSQDRNSYINWLQIEKESHAQPMKKPVWSHKKLEGKPHVFIIIIDAARYDTTNQKFGKSLVTPNIKEFSDVSYNFTHFRSNAPYTIASIGSLLSGYLPELHTVRKMDTMLPKNVKTMPDYFEEMGYKTHVITSNVPFLRNNLIRDFDSVVFCRPFGEENIGKISLVNLQKINIAIKKTNFKNPQFFYIHLLPPHIPYNPPEKQFHIYLDYPNPLYDQLRIKELRAKLLMAENFNIFDKQFNDILFQSYLNNLYYADYLVGKILRAVRNKDIFNNSLIIVSSDHGEAFFEHNKYTHSSTVYEEMIRIPFLLKLPGQKEKQTIDINYTFIDLMPTFSKLLGLKENPHWQGKPIVFDSEFNGYQNKIDYSRATGDDYNISVIFNDYKYIFNSGREELYNLENDPFERKNIIQDDLFLRYYLKQKLFQILEESYQSKTEMEIIEIIKKMESKEVVQELKTLGYL